MRHLLGRLAAALGVLGVLAVLVAPASAVAEGADGRVVRVGVEGTYPPFTFHDAATNELTGFDVEIIRAVAERAGWELEFVETQWDAIFPALDADRIDVIANQVSINPEREARYLFSEPYTYSQGVIATRADNEEITSLADLAGKTSAQSSTSNWADVAREAGADVEAVEGFAQAAELLVQGRVDATINDNITVLDYLANTGTEEIKIAAPAEDSVSRQALIFRQDDHVLRDEANAALASLQADGTLRGISETFFKADVTVEGGGANVDLTDTRSRSSNWELLSTTWWPMLKALIITTIPLTIISFAIGLVLAVLVALARLSHNPVLSGLARGFVSIIRGTPLLLQLFIVFFGLGQVGLKLEPFTAAVVAFSLNVAGYAAEVVRSAILSVPKGQFEAAQTIGLDYRKTLQRIIFPQALRTAVPPLSNTLLSLLKDTSLASVVLVTEVFRVAQIAAGRSGQFLLLYAFAGLYYWVVCTLLAGGQKRLEARLDRFVAK